MVRIVPEPKPEAKVSPSPGRGSARPALLTVLGWHGCGVDIDRQGL
jgi:hypothetical protein